jgi:hypothetical protein
MTEVDQRITIAREYLTGARRRKVDQLPPSVLVRELAETRRQLGQVFDGVNGQTALLIKRVPGPDLSRKTPGC